MVPHAHRADASRTAQAVVPVLTRVCGWGESRKAMHGPAATDRAATNRTSERLPRCRSAMGRRNRPSLRVCRTRPCGQMKASGPISSLPEVADCLKCPRIMPNQISRDLKASQPTVCRHCRAVNASRTFCGLFFFSDMPLCSQRGLVVCCRMEWVGDRSVNYRV